MLVDVDIDADMDMDMDMHKRGERHTCLRTLARAPSTEIVADGPSLPQGVARQANKDGHAAMARRSDSICWYMDVRSGREPTSSNDAVWS